MSSTLWSKAVTRAQTAIERGKLHRIPTRAKTVEQNGIQFVVRLVDSIERKRIARLMQPSHTDPFLPYDEDLYVTDISETHVCLLNKFNVVEHHLLIVTREFESQDSMLTIADFDAMWRCLAEFDSLVFYNSGTVAGASQPHKHLQQVSVPIGEGPDRTPMESILKSGGQSGEIRRDPALPYSHAVANTSGVAARGIAEAARETAVLYEAMLYETDCSPPSDPYNLLATRDWLLLVPRGAEKYKNISVNSLGFAGSLLVRDEEELDLVQQVGPLNVLRHVAVSSQ